MVFSEELSILESCCLRPIMRNSVLEELRVRRLADTWRINMYQIGNCACTKTAHILKVSELIIFLPICCFALEKNSFYCSKCYYRTLAMFRAQNVSCSNKTASQGNSNVTLLTTETPDFIPPTLWPPNSLDLNPVGYCVWNVLQERVYYCTKVDNVVDLK